MFLLLLLFWIFTSVPPVVLQLPLPLSLPVHMSVVPPPWKFLPLYQAELVPIFSNSSPFSFSRSLFVVPPPGWGPAPGLQASFGPYSVAQQLMLESVLPLSPPLSASLLSEHVETEQDGDGQVRFRVRTLFHQWGDSSTRRTCVTLHAFKETEEHKGSCITQPPLGICVVTLTLPGHWFKEARANRLHEEMYKWRNSGRAFNRIHRHTREHQRGGTHHYRYSPRADVPKAQRKLRRPMRNTIQLYYSSFDAALNLKLMSPGCVEDREAKSQRQLLHIRAVAPREEQEDDGTKEDEACLNRQGEEEEDEEEEEVSLDPHVVIRYHRGPVLIGQPIRMSVNLRSNFSAEFVVIKLKVKKGLVSMVAERTLTSDFMAVTVDRSRSSKHDVVSIMCHKLSPLKHVHDPALLQQVACLSVEGLRQSFDVAMTVYANWSVEYSGHSKHLWPRGAAVSVFSFTDRQFCGMAPIVESNTIINTAILASRPVALPVVVLAIGGDGRVSDVTSAVTCRSADENVIKVSADCSAIFVDGSESGLGSTCAVVEFVLGALSGSVCLEVWAPTVPLHVSLSDPVLNAISGWNQFTENGCEPVYQRSTVQVLAQFTAQDSHGRTVPLLHTADWFVDVTDLVSDWLRIEDPRVASFQAPDNVIGLRPGKTSIHVVSEQWDGLLGTCDITVTSAPVSPADLSVQVVSGLGMTVTGSSAHPSVVTATVTAHNVLFNHHQEASISTWLQFSDDTASLLSAFSDLPFIQRLSSLAETVVVVTPGPDQRVLAQGDGGGPLLRAELLVSICAEEPVTSNFIQEGETGNWVDSEDGERGGRGGRVIRALARGSGWVRVNLDWGFLQPMGGEDDVFDFDISDMLTESEGNIYISNFEEDNSGNVSQDDVWTTNRKWTMVGKRRMVSQNHLERAVLTPSQEESSEYFPPSLEKGEREDEGEEGREEQGEKALEVEVGVGAVLALLCLSAVLILANCLPCALRDRRKMMMRKRRESEEEGLEGEREEDTT